jgi:hypothetical protein
VGKGVARRKAREPCPRVAPLDRVGTARPGTAALAPLPHPTTRFLTPPRGIKNATAGFDHGTRSQACRQANTGEIA